ncbi:hypothetical protein FALBO_5110 [Fusarium albosuccineum]|uniref:Uncharacterized protein n=1 Tax=Fusarium albosuccineum TaxID=1237068 RepID=A0A8H4PFS5_9HYPO|nr:hypothetical protein FALBO_5110 [Fusarium albosuccineum]
MVYEPPEHSRDRKASHFLNTYSWHVALWQMLSEGNHTVYTPAICQPWSLSMADTRMEPQFFRGTTVSLKKLTLHMALSDSSPSSKAVLQSVLALSSLRLSGDGAASAYKAKAISSLSQSLKPDNTWDEASRTLVASMLLYLYETFHATYSGPSWAIYLCGVKKIAKSFCSGSKASFRMDNDKLCDWLYYHETMGHFSLVWWAPEDAPDICFLDATALLRQRYSWRAKTDEDGAGCSLAVMNTISSVFKAISLETKGPRISPKERQHLLELEKKLRKGVSELATSTSAPQVQLYSENNTLLHTIAALIFLNRAELAYSGEEPAHRALVKQGLKLIESLSACDAPWPVFTIAFELDEDWARILVLDLMSRTEKKLGYGRLTILRHLVETAWSYHDLGDDMREGQSGSYKARLHAVVRTAPYMPFFT